LSSRVGSGLVKLGWPRSKSSRSELVEHSQTKSGVGSRSIGWVQVDWVRSW